MVTKPRTTTDATAPVTMTALERRIAMESAPSWRPEPGQTLTGRLIGARKAEGGEYGAYPVAIFENVSDGSYVAVHAFHTLLKDGLAKLSPKKDDVVTMHYVGYQETNESKKKYGPGTENEKDRTFYHNYVVFAGDGSDDVESDEFDADVFS